MTDHPPPAPDPASDSASGLAPDADFRVAVIGLAARLPGAPTAEAFWDNLVSGRDSLTVLDDDEYLAAGGDPAFLDDPYHVRVVREIDGHDRFDADHFGYRPAEAALLDPQQRVFLEVAQHAFESAGYVPSRHPGPVGVYAGAAVSRYYAANLAPWYANQPGSLDQMAALSGNSPGTLPTRVSYLLGLTGPSVSVQTACSTSLVAVHLACQDLLAHRCDLALAGGVAINPQARLGYRHVQDGPYSPDGRVRAFDAGAAGMSQGDGAGAVVLKRLRDALADRDAIRAVILGTAVNNDGSRKVGFTAPSVQGQTEVILSALAEAGVGADGIGYVEAHGTGTPVGDPIELTALRDAFDRAGGHPGGCLIGSVKTNIGHLDTAAGIAGLIKTVLALEHGVIPATLHLSRPNPLFDWADAPFRPATQASPWRLPGPRRAAVSSFGIGGTNAHAILEQAPTPEGSGSGAAEVPGSGVADAFGVCVPGVSGAGVVDGFGGGEASGTRTVDGSAGGGGDASGAGAAEAPSNRVPGASDTRGADGSGSGGGDGSGSGGAEVLSTRVPGASGARVPGVSDTRVADASGARVAETVGTRGGEASGARAGETPYTLLVLSARTRAALDVLARDLADHLDAHPGLDPADVAHTLSVGRVARPLRRTLVVRELGEAAEALRAAPRTPPSPAAERPLALLLPGGGAHYDGMGSGLYAHEPVFRDVIDECARILRPVLGHDLRTALYGPPHPGPAALGRNVGQGGSPDDVTAGPEAAGRARSGEHTARLDGVATGLRSAAFPAVVATGYALARLLESHGLSPVALLGHSLGEYTAACLSGVIAIEDVLPLVAERERLFASVGGATLSVRLGPDALAPLLGPDAAVAAVNAAEACTVSGTVEAIVALEKRLADAGVDHHRLRVPSAVHTPLLDPVLDEYRALVAGLPLTAPRIPYVSNVTGTWVTAGQATDPDHWVRHSREPVRFADGVRTLCADAPAPLPLEAGPGGQLSKLVRQILGPEAVAVPALRHAYAQQSDEAFFLEALGGLWRHGIDRAAGTWRLTGRRPRHPRRVPLPGYPYERRRFWIDPPPRGEVPAGGPALAVTGKAEADPVKIADTADLESVAVRRKPHGSKATGPETRGPEANRPEPDGSENRPEAYGSGARRAEPREPAADDPVRQVTALWERALGVEGITPDDNFFDLGGDSLLLMRLAAQVRDLLGTNLSVRRLYLTQRLTIAGFLTEAAESADPVTGAVVGASAEAVEAAVVGTRVVDASPNSVPGSVVGVSAEAGEVMAAGPGTGVAVGAAVEAVEAAVVGNRAVDGLAGAVADSGAGVSAEAGEVMAADPGTGAAVGASAEAVETAVVANHAADPPADAAADVAAQSADAAARRDPVGPAAPTEKDR